MPIEAGADHAVAILVAAIPGQRDQRQRREVLETAQLPRDLVAARPGQPDVEQHRLRPELLRCGERGRAIVNGPRVVARELQQRDEAVGEVAVVVDDEHAPRRLRGRRIARLVRLLRGEPRSLDQRKAHGELAAAAGSLARSLDAAAMQLDQSPYQRETDAETAFGAIERAIALHE